MEKQTIKSNQKIISLKRVSYYFLIFLPDEALLLSQNFTKILIPQVALLEKEMINKVFFDSGRVSKFAKETAKIRESSWTTGSIPHDLRDRRVEITGPVVK
jgi:malate synthase